MGGTPESAILIGLSTINHLTICALETLVQCWDDWWRWVVKKRNTEIRGHMVSRCAWGFCLKAHQRLGNHSITQECIQAFLSQSGPCFWTPEPTKVSKNYRESLGGFGLQPLKPPMENIVTRKMSENHWGRNHPCGLWRQVLGKWVAMYNVGLFAYRDPPEIHWLTISHYTIHIWG